MRMEASRRGSRRVREQHWMAAERRADRRRGLIASVARDVFVEMLLKAAVAK
uniref:Uncharacterized protein n=1 Tax=Arundo donax TaxID=35708 RepID=A0A0A9AHY1_ARUDO